MDFAVCSSSEYLTCFFSWIVTLTQNALNTSCASSSTIYTISNCTICITGTICWIQQISTPTCETNISSNITVTAIFYCTSIQNTILNRYSILCCIQKWKPDLALYTWSISTFIAIIHCTIWVTCTSWRSSFKTHLTLTTQTFLEFVTICYCWCYTLSCYYVNSKTIRTPLTRSHIIVALSAVTLNA